MSEYEHAAAMAKAERGINVLLSDLEHRLANYLETIEGGYDDPASTAHAAALAVAVNAVHAARGEIVNNVAAGAVRDEAMDHSPGIHVRVANLVTGGTV